MFAGKIDNTSFWTCCPRPLQHMLKVLSTSAIASQENGKHLLDNGMFYILMDYQTVPIMQVKPESHRNYIDVQVVLKGKESMGWAVLDQYSSPLGPYNQEKDVIYYQTPPVYNLLASAAGACNVFFPNDIHAPGLSYHLGDGEAESVRKVVGKVPVNLLWRDELAWRGQ